MRLPTLWYVGENVTALAGDINAGEVVDAACGVDFREKFRA